MGRMRLKRGLCVCVRLMLKKRFEPQHASVSVMKRNGGIKCMECGRNCVQPPLGLLKPERKEF